MLPTIGPCSFGSLHYNLYLQKEAFVVPRETERGGPCRPIETEVNRDSGSTYDRVSFLGYLPKTGVVIGSLHTRLIIKYIKYKLLSSFLQGQLLKGV
jgi:hypothetical protein